MKNNIPIYQCSHDDDAGVGEDLAQELGLSFPEAYLFHESMEALALGIRRRRKASFCVLPFCHTVEGEAMGGQINYGDARIGPRPGKRIYRTAEEVLSLPAVDFSTGRMAEVLAACRSLADRGEAVMLNMSGPLTILNVLMETADVFSLTMRPSPSSEAVLQKCKDELLRYTEKAADAGVSVISYADPIAAADILGPVSAARFALGFTLPFLADAGRLLEEKKPGTSAEQKTLFFLCPKTAQTLQQAETIQWKKQPLPSGVAFREACFTINAPSRVVSGACVKQLVNGAPLPWLLVMEKQETKIP